MDSAGTKNGTHGRITNTNSHMSSTHEDDKICLNGEISDSTYSSSGEENSNVESSEEESIDKYNSDLSSSEEANVLAEAQKYVLKRYRSRINSQSESSSESSEDETETQVRMANYKKNSKRKKRMVPSTRKSSSSKSESDEASSSSVDSDDEKISDSFFENSSETNSSSDSDESIKSASIKANLPLPPSKESTKTDSDSDAPDQCFKFVGRCHSVPTLVNRAVGDLRWPFTNLYVKELYVGSDDSEIEENQQEKDTSSNHKPKDRFHSFPGRQKSIMLGRVWTPVWWAVNSGSTGCEYLTYKDVDSIGW